MIEKDKSFVEFTPSSKFYYDTNRKHKNALIYMINYLQKLSSTQYSSYCGIIGQNIEEKTEQKIQLFPVKFLGWELSKFETFTEFNYVETQNYIFMFWPKIFNAIAYLMLRMFNQKY